MPTIVISPEIFEREAKRRLIGTFELMVALGLRRRDSVWERVRAGTLPEPVFKKENVLALWDRDAIELPPDRKESSP